MPWWLFFVLAIGKSVGENDASCAHHDTLFDIGLEKVLKSTKFEAIPLPDINERIGDRFQILIKLYNGTFYYLKNLERGTHNSIRVTDAGIEVVLKVEGGMFRVYYPRGDLRSPILDRNISVDVYLPHVSLALYVREPVPTHLALEAFASDTKRTAVNVRNEGNRSIVFALANRWAYDNIRDKVTQKLDPVLQELVQHFLYMVELYARNGTKAGDGKHPIPEPEDEASHINLFRQRYRVEDIHSDMFDPIHWEIPSAWGIFDYCIRRIVLDNGLDPLRLGNISNMTWASEPDTLFNVIVYGLSNIRRGGDIFVSAEDCGLVARVALLFHNITVQFTVKNYLLAARANIHAYEVNALLEVREVNKTLQVVDYKLNFTLPIDVDARILTPVIGPTLHHFGLPRRTRLTKHETAFIEDASRKHIEAAVLKVGEFIKDPAAYMPWDTSIIDAFRRYKNKG